MNNISGLILMVKGVVVIVEIGWVYYFSFMVLISVNLGVMNFFFILFLDGG